MHRNLNSAPPIINNNPDYTTSSYYFESYVRMFAGCTALESVSMNINLRCAYGMFEGCTSLKTVYCPLMEIVWEKGFRRLFGSYVV